MSVSVYLADLRHNYSGVLANDCMPLSVGYLKAVMDRDLAEADSRLFAYPDHLWKEIQANPPDVLMVSNYMWCEQLSFHLAKLTKRLRAETLVVMGGPSIPIEDDRKIEFLKRHPEIDIYILGEAEFLAVGKSVEALRARTLPSCLHNKGGGEVAINTMRPRNRNLEDIPSPWLTGIMEPFFDGKLAPMIETNRGCPFTCSFCVQGTKWYTKLHYFEENRLRDEIAYIADKIHQLCPSMGTLRIADSNYGMFKRDSEISGWIGDAQAKFGWPTFIDATTGKNRPERIIESLEKVNGALVLYQAVQSLDDDALRNIKRSNIRKEAYEQIMVHVRGRGLRSVSDLILGLPGETLRSHIEGIHELIDAGTHEMHNFQSMLLKGAELETLEQRDRFKFTSRFRVLPKNWGVYGGERVFDMDEIVVATDTLSFEDYVEARIYHFVCSLFWNNSWFIDAVSFANRLGVKSSALLDAVVQAVKNDDGRMRQLTDQFVKETRGELFESEEACRDFYARDENFARLVQGEIADNLMYKYRAIASFFEWPALHRLSMNVIHQLVVESGARDAVENFDELWRDLHVYVDLLHAHGATREELLAPQRRTMHYDIAAWIEAETPRDASAYRFDRPTEIEFALPEEAATELGRALEVWTLSLKGLTKGVTRIRSAAQVRMPSRVGVGPLFARSDEPALPANG